MLKQYKILFCLEKLSSFGLKGLKLQNKCFFSSSTGKKDEETEKPPEFFDPKKKISNNTFLKIELSQNPEFDKAFPFLRSHKKPSTLFRKDEELDFIDSLSYEKKTVEPKDNWEIYTENHKRFVEGYRSPSGPIKWMGEEDKQKIHTIIDAKLDELEATGLSREEILYDDGRKGIPLSQDPFFQLLKKKKMVREMLLKPGETFTVEKIVALAVKQNIGLDPSFSSFEKNFGTDDAIGKLRKVGLIPLHRRRENPNKEQSDRYFSMNTFPNQEKLKEILNKRTSFHYLPPEKSKLRKKFLRYVNWQDIHWRNTELLTKFLNTGGQIKNRYQNRLTMRQQKQIAKCIKNSRNMMLLPTFSFVRPTDKKSLTTLHEDVENHCQKAINIETGHLYYMNQKPKQQDPQEEFMKNYPKDKIISDEKVKQLKDLEFSYVDFSPTVENSEILEAQLFARRLKENELIKSGIDVKKLKEQTKNEEINLNPILSKYYESRAESESKLDSEKLKESFTKFENKVNQISPTKFLDLFLVEKTADAPKLKKMITEANAFKVQENFKDSSLEEAIKMLSEIKKQIGIQEIFEEKDEENIKETVNYKFLNSSKEKEILKDFFSS